MDALFVSCVLHGRLIEPVIPQGVEIWFDSFCCFGKRKQLSGDLHCVSRDQPNLLLVCVVSLAGRARDIFAYGQ